MGEAFGVRKSNLRFSSDKHGLSASGSHATRNKSGSLTTALHIQKSKGAIIYDEFKSCESGFAFE